MKKMLLRTAIVLLAVAMLLGCFAACGKNGEPSAATEEPNVGEGTTAEEIHLDFPQEDNGNKDIVILLPSELDYDIQTTASSESVANEVFKRNENVQDYLGIALKFTPVEGEWSKRTQFNDRIRTSAMGDPAEFDLVSGLVSCTFAACAMEGLFLNVNTVSNVLNLENEWWVQNLNDDFAINDNLYGVLGDLSLSIYKQMAVIYFNQNMISTYGMDSPYQLVRDGEWYVSTLMEMAMEVEQSVDGEYDPAVNTMGLIQSHVAGRGWLTALEIEIYDRSDTGYTMKQTPDERTINIYNYMYRMFSQENTIYSTDEDQADLYITAFRNNTALFSLGYIATVEQFREMTSNYGLVPLCKWDENQAEYHTPLTPSCAMYHLPVNTPDASLAAKTIEAMSFFSYRDVTPEYYEIALGYTYARDPDMREMLALVRATASLSFAGAYNTQIGSGASTIWNLFQMNEKWRSEDYVGDNLNTYWASNYSSWNVAIRLIYSRLS